MWMSNMSAYIAFLLSLPPTLHPIPPIWVSAEHQAWLPGPHQLSVSHMTMYICLCYSVSSSYCWLKDAPGQKGVENLTDYLHWETHYFIACILHLLCTLLHFVPFLLLCVLHWTFLYCYLRNLGTEQNLGMWKRLITWTFWLSVAVFEACFLMTSVFGLPIWL